MASWNLRKKVLISGIVAAALVSSCSKDEDDDADADADTDSSGVSSTGGGTSVSGIANKLASAYPSALALSVFPQGGSAALHLDDAEVADPNAKKSVKEKVVENKAKLNGEGECLSLAAVTPKKASAPETCYEFDSDMNPFEVAGETRSFGTVDGKNAGGEACMVAFARGQVEDTVQQIDQATAMAAALVCQGKKKGLEKELAAGESIDLVAAFADLGAGKISVTEAKLARLTDAADGTAVYRSDLTLTHAASGHALSVHLVHNPGVAGEKGTLWFQRTHGNAQPKVVALQDPSNGGSGSPDGSGTGSPGGSGSGPMVDPNNSTNKIHAMSIAYTKDTDTAGKPRVSFEVRRAAIVNSVEPFSAEGLVNYGGLPLEAANSEIHAIQYVAYSGNPDTNEGNLSYWMNPGGSYHESARGFLFNIAADATGALSGCGVSGATANVSVRKALAEPSATNVLAAVRYWHPREDDNISANKDPRYSQNEDFFVTQQCYKQNVTTGLYEIAGDSLLDARGYTVIAQAAVTVNQPPPPKKLDGELKNKK